MPRPDPLSPPPSLPPRPGWQTMPCRCKKCQHDWDGWTPTHVPVATWVAHIRTFYCPSCGASFKSIMIRTESNTPPQGESRAR